MVASLLPDGNRPLQLRLKRQLMGFVSYLMFLVPLLFSVQQGWVRFGYVGLAGFAVVALVVNVVFYLLIRSGYSARYDDPSLAQPQIMVAVTLALIMSYYTDEGRVVTMMLFFTAFFFGVFSLSTRQYLAMSAATVAGYALMLFLKFEVIEPDAETRRLEILFFIMLIVILVWMSFLGGYLAQLRFRLSQKKDALAVALTRLQELASHDELTGTYNRRHLMELLEQQRERAERYGEPFSVCILDLDHFKSVNDTHGHLIGDQALREFSKRMQRLTRRMDSIGRAPIDGTFGRYGGEEFMVLLPYTSSAGAAVCAERLRLELIERPLDTEAGPLPMTFSAGVATHRPGENVAHTLSRADAALYRAKAAGRDRFEVEE